MRCGPPVPRWRCTWPARTATRRLPSARSWRAIRTWLPRASSSLPPQAAAARSASASAAHTDPDASPGCGGCAQPRPVPLVERSKEVATHRQVPVARRRVVRGLDVGHRGELLALHLVELVGEVAHAGADLPRVLR